MPKIIIKQQNQPHQRFRCNKSTIMIGRDEDCDIILPNVSVSRQHAKITLKSAEAILEDIDSENGINVNGTFQKSKKLQSGDEFIIGTFTLVFLGDRQRDQFYRGRAIVYFPEYEPSHNQPTQEPTHKLSFRDAKKILQEKAYLNHGCIIDSGRRKLFPESNPMTFGDKNTMVRIQGFLIWGCVATITWNGTRHVIESNRWWVPLKINGKKQKNAILKKNDKIQIGKSQFTYLVRTPGP